MAKTKMKMVKATISTNNDDENDVSSKNALVISSLLSKWHFHQNVCIQYFSFLQFHCFCDKFSSYTKHPYRSYILLVFFCFYASFHFSCSFSTWFHIARITQMVACRLIDSPNMIMESK